MKTITLTGANITDDKWHTVRVSRRGNTISLQLDYKAKAYGTTGQFSIAVDKKKQAERGYLEKPDKRMRLRLNCLTT